MTRSHSVLCQGFYKEKIITIIFHSAIKPEKIPLIFFRLGNESLDTICVIELHQYDKAQF